MKVTFSLRFQELNSMTIESNSPIELDLNAMKQAGLSDDMACKTLQDMTMAGLASALNKRLSTVIAFTGSQAVKDHLKSVEEKDLFWYRQYQSQFDSAKSTEEKLAQLECDMKGLVLHNLSLEKLVADLTNTKPSEPPKTSDDPQPTFENPSMAVAFFKPFKV